jgi:hypothetical protein
MPFPSYSVCPPREEKNRVPKKKPVQGNTGYRLRQLFSFNMPKQKRNYCAAGPDPIPEERLA